MEYKTMKQLRNCKKYNDIFNYAIKYWDELCKKAQGKNCLSVAEQLANKFQFSYVCCAEIANIISISKSVGLR